MHRISTVAFIAWAIFISPVLAGVAVALPNWSVKAEADWWIKNPGPASWPAASDALTAQLAADYKQNGAASFSNPDFQGWLEHLEWVRLGLEDQTAITDPDDLKTFVALGHDDSVSHLFVEKLKDGDTPKALKNLIEIGRANIDDLHEYAALGVAFSVVFDEPFPTDWPHPQVSRDAVPFGDLDVVKRFQFYVQSNRNHKLDLDPTTLTVENLVFLVDSQVSLAELAYAQQNRIPSSHFADAFFAIKYDDSRIGNAAAVYDWPYPTYKLADIEQKGGICIDQAYYAETLGKGRGIPTIQFTGYGMDGAHAWFGYLDSSGRWELDCGRYEEQNFPKGFAVDPQTWQRIDDATIENLFKSGAKDTDLQHESTALLWARLNRNDASYTRILDDAHTIMPEWSDTWRLRAGVVDTSGDLDKKKQFYGDWIGQFGNYPDMKVEGQKRLYRALKAANDPGADDLLKDIIVQNRTEGFDLGISAGASAMEEKLKAADWDGAQTAFHNTIRDFGEQGGLTLYVEVVEPYVHTCLENGKINMAGDAVNFTQDRMKIDMDSQTGQHFLELKNEVTSAKMASHQ